MRKKITLPTSFEEITLGTLQKIRALEGDEDVVAVKLIEIVTGIKPDEALRMKMRDRDEILNTLVEFLSVQPTKLIKRFTFDGIEYGFNPNLNEMTHGEFTDLKTYENNFEFMHRMMAVLYRPIIKKHDELYEIESYEGSFKYADVMKQWPSHIALGAHVFFCDLARELLVSSLKSLRAEAQTTSKKHLVRSGDGMTRSLDLLMTTSQSLKKSQNFHLNNALPRLLITLTSTN